MGFREEYTSGRNFFLISSNSKDREETKHRGSLINTTSFIAPKNNFSQTNYGATKAGIVGFTINAIIKLYCYNITIKDS